MVIKKFYHLNNGKDIMASMIMILTITTTMIIKLMNMSKIMIILMIMRISIKKMKDMVTVKATVT